MNNKLLFLAIAPLLVSYKSIVGIASVLAETQKDEFPLHLAIYNDASSRLSLESTDERNCKLAILLSEIQYLNGNSPLHFAASIGDMPLALHLLATGADKDKINRSGKTPCDLAAENEHYDLAGALLAKALDEDGPLCLTPLHRAALTCELSVVERLLTAGAWVDKRDPSGSTALHYAALNCEASIVERLLSAGASVNITDLSGEIALHKAVVSKKAPVLDVIEILLQADAKINATTDRGATPLLLASHCGHPKVVQRLLSSGAAMDKRDNNGWTPLHWAARAANDVTVNILLEAGAKQLRNGELTPLDIAVEQDADCARERDQTSKAELRKRYAAIIGSLWKHADKSS